MQNAWKVAAVRPDWPAKTVIAPQFSSGKKIVRAGGTSSQLFPVGERHQFVQNFLQSLKPACMVPGRAEFVFAAQQVEPVRLTDLRYLVPQLGDAFFDRILHSDKASTNTCANYSPKRRECVPERLR
jgi:hypothetical protein